MPALRTLAPTQVLRLVAFAGLDFAGCGLGLDAYLGGHAVGVADEMLYVWQVGWGAGQE